MADSPPPPTAEETPAPPPADVAANGTTQGAGQATDEGRGRIFPCESCGADLTFHVGQQKLQCPYCGFTKELELPADAAIEEQDFRAALGRLAEMRAAGQADQQETSQVRCDACGAEVVFVGSLSSSHCAFCGSPIQRENIHRGGPRIPVDGVLTFRFDERAARQKLDEWIRSRWFAPNDFLSLGAKGDLAGVYSPYWTFDTMTFNRYQGSRGEHYWVTVGSGKDKRRERRTRWYPASGQFQRFFDDVLTFASTGLPKWITEALEPWPLSRCIPFTQQALAGFQARTYDVPLDQAFVGAKERIDSAIAAEVRSRIGGDEQRIDWIRTQYTAITYKHLLLPCWLLAHRYKGEAYHLAVNAGTGEVQGERPYSWVKITLAVLAGVAAAAAAAGVYYLTQA